MCFHFATPVFNSSLLDGWLKRGGEKTKSLNETGINKTRKNGRGLGREWGAKNKYKGVGNSSRLFLDLLPSAPLHPHAISMPLPSSATSPVLSNFLPAKVERSTSHAMVLSFWGWLHTGEIMKVTKDIIAILFKGLTKKTLFYFLNVFIFTLIKWKT